MLLLSKLHQRAGMFQVNGRKLRVMAVEDMRLQPMSVQRRVIKIGGSSPIWRIVDGRQLW